MKIELLDINISGFQNLAENQLFTVDGPGLYGIVGKNLDEGGSNASGKTSFVQAISAGVLGPDCISITNKEIKSRILDVAPQIIATLRVNGRILKINRIIGGKLSASIDGNDIIGKSDDIQQKILDILGISADHFLHLTHKMQGSVGGFLLLKDQQKKEFLKSFFDLSKLEKLAETNDNKLKQLATETIQTSERIRGLTLELGALHEELKLLQSKLDKYSSTEYLSLIAEKKSALTKKEMELERAKSQKVEDILSADEMYTKILLQKQQALEDLEKTVQSTSIENKKIEEEISSIQLFLIKPVDIPEDLARDYKLIEKRLKDAREARNGVQDLVTQLQIKAGILDEKITETKKQIDSLDNNKCPTCGQPVNANQHKNNKITLITSLNELDKEKECLNKKIEELLSTPIESEEKLLEQKKKLDDRIAAIKASKNENTLRQRLDLLQGQISLNVQKVHSLEKNVKQLDDAMKQIQISTIKSQKMQIEKLEAETLALSKELKFLQKEFDDARQNFLSTKNKHDSILAEVELLRQKIKASERENNVHEAIRTILSKNGFIGYIFDNILDELNREANENIKMIPVISRMTIHFSSDKLIKATGNISKEITYQLFDGDASISFNSLSGSEKQSLLLAIDAAVDSVLCNRIGVDINYKILDEQFGWVDGQNKEFLLEFLKKKYRDKTILIVDHGSELNAAIDKKIIITKCNGLATISCQ